MTPRNEWVWEFIDSPAERDGFITWSYRVWESTTSRERGDPPFLANSHKAMIRETHQRRRLDGDGKLIHVSGAKVDPFEVDAFLREDSRALHRDSSGDYRDERGRKVEPVTFPDYWGRLEPLDPNWERETFTVTADEQVAAIIESYLDRAAAKGWTGDRRGTSLSLQVGASGDDGRVSSSRHRTVSMSA